MKPLGLGEQGGLTVVREGSSFVAYLRYRDHAGRGHRLKRAGRSRAEASRRALKAYSEALGMTGSAEFAARTAFDEAAKLWLAAFEGQVQRGARSPSTLDEYRYLVKRVIEPGVGSLRLAELTTPRLDRFVQAVLADRGYATAKLTHSVLSGICGWLVRQGAIASNPVRDLTPLEQNRDTAADLVRRSAEGASCSLGRPAAQRGHAEPEGSAERSEALEPLRKVVTASQLIACPPSADRPLLHQPTGPRDGPAVEEPVAGRRGQTRWTAPAESWFK